MSTFILEPPQGNENTTGYTPGVRTSISSQGDTDHTIIQIHENTELSLPSNMDNSPTSSDDESTPLILKPRQNIQRRQRCNSEPCHTNGLFDLLRRQMSDPGTRIEEDLEEDDGSDSCEEEVFDEPSVNGRWFTLRDLEWI